ncbi:MAG: plastocyanin/azurin family copper-binding protein [Acidimicrobiia bacterium]
MTVRRLRRTSGLLAISLLVALLLVACGGGGDDGGGGKAYVEPKGEATEQIDISAKNFSFTPDKITTDAGIAEITLESTAGLHDLVFANGYQGFQVEADGTGQSDSKKIDLTKGTYTFYCSLPGHRAAGMEGTITVK